MTVARFMACIVVLTVPAMAHAQSPAAPTRASNAQETFDLLKTLAGNWQGPVTTDNPAWSTDKPVSIAMRVVSHGNALVHELDTGTPELTVFYVQNDSLTLIHYCDYGNRPHLVAGPPSDGKRIEFTLVSFSGSNAIGHISHAVFTIADSDHHVEDWTFMLADGTPVHARMDLKRVRSSK